jgi:hypothetical protein
MFFYFKQILLDNFFFQIPFLYTSKTTLLFTVHFKTSKKKKKQKKNEVLGS